ncbi:MAG: thymidylate synthase [Candidatus Vogelbacteria bacterium CG10_big_fil_rev_8_21_14_0_10_51_16]|uniref:Thymidylate synthase n=1 Tax=Candidatus Vogelbacteria bacterium CG10_big_fil_rev_8_21_14_0_10_51_16 TaxID=1975045 RepID=A0A2H0RD66_9BACT|nr:MAG: thymidylate synthase [Candidatus Vogelbacteria bacterium CG10_big_fil_rev_8_21_14_0_10_51_16]
MQDLYAYKSLKSRKPDSQYQDALRRILKEGEWVEPIHKVMLGADRAKMLVGLQLRYEIENGFPLITERDLSGKFMAGAIGEIAAFINGEHTQAGLEKYGCKWWKKWVTKEKCAIFGLPEGDLGPGSYGAAFHDFPNPNDDGAFNQFKEVMAQMKERPFLRTHIISPWIPPYTIQHKGLPPRKVVVAPCHGWLHFMLTPNKKELSLHHFQRSGDMPVGVPFNIMQYASLGMAVSQILGYKFVRLIHTISDAHIYESQIPFVKKLLEREPRRLPTVTMNTKLKNIFAIRPKHFDVADYKPHEKMLIPTPV